MAATDRRARTTSNAMIRSRNLGVTGKRKNVRKRTKPTWTARRIWAGTIPYAAYRWKSDMSTPTAMRNTWTFPLKWLAAPSSASTNFSASLRASSLTPTSSPGISRPVSSTRLSVTAFSRSCEGLHPPHLSCSPPDSPGRQGNVRQPERDPVAGIAQSEERYPPAAKGQCLCSFHGHPEHDRSHRPVHGVERLGVAESEVLQDRP